MYRGNIPDIFNWQMQFALKETVISVYKYPKEWISRKKIKIGLRQSLVLSSLPSKSCL